MADASKSTCSMQLTPAVESLSSRLGGILKDAFQEDADEDELPGGNPPPKADPQAEAPADSKAQDSLTEPSYDVQVTLADQQADPNSPLYSVKSFDELGLHEDLLKGIYSMKFTKPSKIQERALPLLLQNPPRNMIGQSQSGTGKTAAFALTMLSRIDFSVDKPQAIALAPSRELARQIMDVVQTMGRFTPVKTAFAIPDAIKRGEKVHAHLIVGTPGKTFDLIKTRALDPSAVKVFVLDEADNMLDQQGLGEQSIRVKNTMPKTCQVVLFSATFPEHVRAFAMKFAPSANEIRLKQEELSVESIKQFYMDCNTEEHKYDVLVELYSLLTIGQSIIFCAKRETADRIARRMTDEGHRVDSLHGKLDNAERDRTIDSFRSGRSKVLIATNVIARGIDIQQVTLVINYDLPLTQAGEPDSETYLHRIGRTGRFGRRGVSINFVYNAESKRQMEAIEQALHCPIVRVQTEDVEAMESTIKEGTFRGGSQQRSKATPSTHIVMLSNHCTWLPCALLFHLCMARDAGAHMHGDVSLLSMSADDSEDVANVSAALAPIPESTRAQLQRWILSIALVNFDLELGPDVECMYPALDISKEEKDNIAFSAFPDTTVFSDGSLVFSWRVREVPLGASSAMPPRIPDMTEPKVQETGPLRRVSLRHSARQITRSFLGASYELESVPANRPPTSGSRSTSYMYGYTFFLQKRDPLLRRGYFQKSLVLLSHLPYVALFGEMAARVGPVFFEHGLPVLESLVQEIAQWAAPSPGAMLSLPCIGSLLSATLPHGNEAQNGDWASTHGAPILASVPSTPLPVVFQQLVPDLWLVWECMLLADPILVVGRDPRSVSEAVWHMLDLIRPVACAGDYRPYFHIHDYDFRALVSRNKPQAGTVLGVTNPFFLQTCAHWPHVLQLGYEACNVPPKSARRGTVGALAPSFTSKRKRHVSKDRGLLSEVLALAAKPDGHGKANVLLRRYFADLTERFLAPLNRYMASLIPAHFDLSSPAEPPRIKPFHNADFLASLKTHSTPLKMRQRSLSTNASLRHALYADFLQCPNFSLWLQARIHAAQEEQRQRRLAALCTGDVDAFARAHSTAECTDLYVRLFGELTPGRRWRTEGGVLKPTGTDARALETRRAQLKAQLEKLQSAMPAELRAELDAQHGSAD